MRLNFFIFSLILLNFVSIKVEAHSPTWTNGIACIVYSHCSGCHNTKGIAPFSLMNYQDVYANRLSIAASVQAKSMPPFPASQDKVKYAHSNTLTQHEIDEIAEWVTNFAPYGNANDTPKAPSFNSSFELVTPDVIFKIPTYTVNTTTDMYRAFVIPTNNASEKFIKSIEVVPGNKEIVHHVLVFQDNSTGPLNSDLADPEPGYTSFGGTGSNSSVLLNGWVPGQTAYHYPNGFGAKLDTNAYIVIQIHYPGGISNQKDSTHVRIKYYSTPQRETKMDPVVNHGASLIGGPLAIPANQTKTYKSEFSLPIFANITVFSALPHMHLIGKSIKAYAIKPSGDTIHIVNVPNWDFHWQKMYHFQKPILIPGGSKIYGEALYDNTASNPNNPSSPPINVVQGENTKDEMMIVYVNYTLYQSGDTSIIIDTSSHHTHDSSCFKSTLSIAELGVEKFSIFPNPSQGKIKINEEITIKSIKLYNNLGQLVYLSNKIENEIDLSYLTNGTYYFQIIDKEGKSFHRKFLKE